MKDFSDTLSEVCARPVMYVGHTSVRAVSHYLAGYCHALREAGHPEPPMMAWQRWVEKRFLIQGVAWHWSRILVHGYGTDEAALGATPALYSQFQKEYEESGAEGIEAALRLALREKYGEYPSVLSIPRETTTDDSWFSDPPPRHGPKRG